MFAQIILVVRLHPWCRQKNSFPADTRHQADSNKAGDDVFTGGCSIVLIEAKAASRIKSKMPQIEQNATNN
jgi:hypothetical protein